MALTPEGTPYVESTDLVAAFPAASLSLANRVDLVGVLPFADSAARATAIPSPTDGQFTYLQDTNTPEFYDGASFVPIAGGKILQIVYAYSVSNTTTTSTSYVTTGIVGTITPSLATSQILVIASSQFSVSTSNIGYMTIFRGTVAGTNLGPANGFALITTASQAPQSLQTAVWLDSPNTTSAQAYTIGFKTNGGGVTVNNANYGTITLMEVGA
jgi:hypothetical protein